MLVTQIYNLVNDAIKQATGEENLLQEDLGNVVDVGNTLENRAGYDNYVRALNDKIGKTIFHDRSYLGRIPSVFRDSWEYGSILEKISFEMPEATENESWELEDRTSYDPNIFYKPKVSTKFFNKKRTFEIPLSITEMQVKSSFHNASQLNSFVSGLRNYVNNAMRLALENLTMRTINNFTGQIIYDANNGGSLSNVSTSTCVNCLYLYNQATGQSLTTSNCIHNPDFIRFTANLMKNYQDYLTSPTVLFNKGQQVRFTPSNKLHTILLSQFKNAADTYLYGNKDEFKADEYSKLPAAETVVKWQGVNSSFSFSDASSIYITTANGNDVQQSGILAVMYDYDALGVMCENPRVTTNYNPKAEFWSEWHKYDAQYFNDFNENYVVFLIA